MSESGTRFSSSDMVPREHLMEMEARVQYLDDELQRQAVGREDLVKLEVHARTIEEELRWYKDNNQVLTSLHARGPLRHAFLVWGHGRALRGDGGAERRQHVAERDGQRGRLRSACASLARVARRRTWCRASSCSRPRRA